jgi:hypothetical protein
MRARDRGGTGAARAWDVERMGNALYLVGYTDSYGAGGMDVLVLSATIARAPEPGSLGLLAAGLAGLAFARKRKRRKYVRGPHVCDGGSAVSGCSATAVPGRALLVQLAQGDAETD